MEVQLAGSGLDYEFIEGVEGRELPASSRAALVDEAAVARFPRWLKPGTIGCILSHRLVLERIAAADEGPALVLEDDAVLSDDLAGLTAALVPMVPSDGVILLNFRSLSPCRISATGLPAVRGHELFMPVGLHTKHEPVSSLAYLVGQEAARRMAELIVPVRFASDSWGEYVAGGAVRSLWCVLPRPVMPEPWVMSTVKHGRHVGLVPRLRETSPIRQFRQLNRRRLAWLHNRVQVVD